MWHVFVSKIFHGFLVALFLPVAFLFPGEKTAPLPSAPDAGSPQVSVATTIPQRVATSTQAFLPKALPPKAKELSVAKDAAPKGKVSTPGPLIVAATSPVTASAGALDKNAIISLTNAERQKIGLPPLSASKDLLLIAKAKAVDMIAKGYFAHISPDGIGVSALAEQYGYQFLNIGENLALGDFQTSVEVVTGWMNSPGHRANILNANFTEIGVAALQGLRNGKTVWYVVQEFGRPSSACPSPDPLLKEKITVYQGEITALDTTLKNLKAEMASLTGDQVLLVAKTNDYNTIISTYNNLVATTKTAIAQYNTEAQSFNACARVE